MEAAFDLTVHRPPTSAHFFPDARCIFILIQDGSSFFSVQSPVTQPFRLSSISQKIYVAEGRGTISVSKNRFRLNAFRGSLCRGCHFSWRNIGECRRKDFVVARIKRDSTINILTFIKLYISFSVDT